MPVGLAHKHSCDTVPLNDSTSNCTNTYNPIRKKSNDDSKYKKFHENFFDPNKQYLC
jgi:hypothetical protein